MVEIRFLNLIIALAKGAVLYANSNHNPEVNGALATRAHDDLEAEQRMTK